MKIRENLKLFILLLHTLLILLLSFLVSADSIWTNVFAQESTPGEDSWFYKEDSEGNPLYGKDLLKREELKEDYKQISLEYKEAEEIYASDVVAEKQILIESTRKYANASIDQMLQHTAKLQFLIQGYEWMLEDYKKSLLTDLNSELKYLNDQKNSLEDLGSIDEIKNQFKTIRKSWLQFRIVIRESVRNTIRLSIKAQCDAVFVDKDADYFDTREKEVRFAAFTVACEDWGTEDVDLSGTLFDLIKVL